MKIYLQFPLFFLLITQITFAQIWESQSNRTSNNLNGVYFSDSINGTAVGENGTIFRTTDGGTTWISQPSGTTYNLYGVSFTDVNNGTAVGDFGIILKTDNGGATWNLQSSGTTNVLYGVSFTDTNNGTAVGDAGTILRTTNGGTNWNSQPSGTTNYLFGVSFTDENTGTAVGSNGTILRTTNGGTNWISQSSGITNVLYGVSFIDINNGSAVGEGGKFLKTGNGGATWSSIASGTTNDLHGVSFADTNNGIAVGEGGTILRYTIYNNIPRITTWESGTTEALKSVDLINQNTIWAVGDNGTILKYSLLGFITIDSPNFNDHWPIGSSQSIEWTSDYVTNVRIEYSTDAGLSWIEIIASTPAANGNYTWVVPNTPSLQCNVRVSDVSNPNISGEIIPGDWNRLLSIYDPTILWMSQPSGTTNDLYGVSFADQNNGIAVGSDGTIRRTTNGGTTWMPQSSGTTNDLYEVSFNNANNGTAVGANGTILRTTDGGTTWNLQPSGTTNNLYSVCFTDSNTGTAVGCGWNGPNWENIIIRTTNGGSTWMPQSSGTTGWLIGVSFIDANHGWVIDNWHGTLTTTNGGTTWTLSSFKSILSDVSLKKTNTWYPDGLCGVSFADINNGTVVGWDGGSGGFIKRTTNGGTTWDIRIGAIPIQKLFAVSFADLNNGIAVGENSLMLKTTNGGTSWAEQLSETTNSVNSVVLIDENTGWAVGDNGTILKYSREPAYLSPSWSKEIIIEDAGGTESAQTLTFGQAAKASDSIDESLGEYELPPPPPPNIFDARFNLPTNPEVSSFKDYRDSSKKEITWTMSFQPGPGGYPITFNWDSTDFPEGTFYLKDGTDGTFVNVNMKNHSSYVLTEPTITSLNISYKRSCSVVSVNNGWNMIAVPLITEDMSVSKLYPTATSFAFSYNGAYVIEDTIVAGIGYWLKFGGNEEMQICGLALGDSVPLRTGWNMLGVYEGNVPVTQITTTPPDIIATYFFGFEDGYNIADTLRSGKGYWVRVTEDGIR